MAGPLQRELRSVRDTLLEEPVSPRVAEPRDINLHYCRYVAETVSEAVDDPEVHILEDGGRGFVHTWLYYDGRHYDAECIEGVEDYHDLPFFQRHPGAAVHVEPETADPPRLRKREISPLYPDSGEAGPPEPVGLPISTEYWPYGVGSVLVGLLLVGIGFGGNWALNGGLIRPSMFLHRVFVNTEILGLVVVIVAPVVFFVLLPGQKSVPKL